MKNGIFLLIGVISAFQVVLFAGFAKAQTITGPRLLLSEQALKLNLDRPSLALGDASGIAAALGGSVVRGALGPSAMPLPKEQIAPGILLAGVIFFAGFKVWDGFRIWSDAIALDIQATDFAGVVLPARRPFYGMPNVSTTSALGVQMNW